MINNIRFVFNLYSKTNCLLKSVLLLCCLASFQVFAQNPSTFQAWTDYEHLNKLDGNWIAFSDYGFRWSNSSTVGFKRIHARPSVEYKYSGQQSFRAGVGLFYQDNIATDNSFEVRPWQGYRLGWPNINRFRIYHYARLEERMVYGLEGDDFAFTLKLRYKLGVDIPIANTTIKPGTFYIPISLELFANLAIENEEAASDRNRIEVGLGYRYNRDLKLRILYTYQSIKNNVEDGVLQNDNIIRVSVIQNFGFE